MAGIWIAIEIDPEPDFDLEIGDSRRAQVESSLQ